MQLNNQLNATSPFQAPQGTSPAVPAADSTSSTGSSSNSNSATSTATLTANDFLQLLVTELQNQDPTANTDPNEYVDQLVQVNSLKQQIQMSQTLDGGPTLTGQNNGMLQELMQMNQTLSGAVAPASQAVHAASAAPVSAATQAKTNGSAVVSAGNLSGATNPAMQASAETVATALTANPNHAAGSGNGLAGQIPASQAGAFAQFAARLRANPPAQP